MYQIPQNFEITEINNRLKCLVRGDLITGQYVSSVGGGT